MDPKCDTEPRSVERWIGSPLPARGAPGVLPYPWAKDPGYGAAGCLSPSPGIQATMAGPSLIATGAHRTRLQARTVMVERTVTLATPPGSVQ